MSKLKKLVAVAEETKRWDKTGFSSFFFLPFPSFFYSKSQLLYQALQGSCSVHTIEGAQDRRAGVLSHKKVARPGPGKLPWRFCFSVFSIHTKRSQLV